VTTEWTWANKGVSIENGHLVWFEQLGAVSYASGAASTQEFDDFRAKGPAVEGVPDDVLAELTREIDEHR